MVKSKTDTKTVAAPKKPSPWIEYVNIQRNKKVNKGVAYRDVLKNIDKKVYALWRKKNYPDTTTKPVKKIAVKSPVKKIAVEKVKKPVTVKSPVKKIAVEKVKKPVTVKSPVKKIAVEKVKSPEKVADKMTISTRALTDGHVLSPTAKTYLKLLLQPLDKKIHSVNTKGEFMDMVKDYFPEYIGQNIIHKIKDKSVAESRHYILQYIVDDILILAQNSAVEHKRNAILTRDIALVISHDAELKQTLGIKQNVAKALYKHAGRT